MLPQRGCHGWPTESGTRLSLRQASTRCLPKQHHGFAPLCTTRPVLAVLPQGTGVALPTQGASGAIANESQFHKFRRAIQACPASCLVPRAPYLPCPVPGVPVGQGAGQWRAISGGAPNSAGGPPTPDAARHCPTSQMLAHRAVCPSHAARPGAAGCCLTLLTSPSRTRHCQTPRNAVRRRWLPLAATAARWTVFDGRPWATRRLQLGQEPPDADAARRASTGRPWTARCCRTLDNPARRCPMPTGAARCCPVLLDTLPRAPHGPPDAAKRRTNRSGVPDGA